MESPLPSKETKRGKGEVLRNSCSSKQPEICNHGENQICAITEQELSLKGSKEMYGLQGVTFLGCFFFFLYTNKRYSEWLCFNKLDYKKKCWRVKSPQVFQFSFLSRNYDMQTENFLIFSTAPSKTNKIHDYHYFKGLLKNVSYFSQKIL